MSSILKALEKAEESNGSKRMAGDSDLIRSRKSRPTWVMPVSVLCGAAAATLATFAIMGGFSRHAPVAQLPVAVTRSAPSVVTPLNPVTEAPVPVPSAPVEPAGVTSAPGPKAAPAENLKESAVLNSKAAPVLKPAAAAPLVLKPAVLVGPHAVSPAAGKARAAAPQQAAVRLAPVRMAPAQPATVVAVKPAPVASPAPAPPELKVSGIAWQSNGESSFAVVNGRAVLQGATVDGFKVLEIRPDMVRFSGSSGNIDVPLGDDK